MTHRPLPWTDDPSITAPERLRRLQVNAPHLLRKGRGPEFDPDWRVRLGYVGATRVEDTDANRREFNCQFASDALLRGMGLIEIPWGADWMTLAASVAKWAHGALTQIVELERNLHEETGRAQRLAVELEATIAADRARTAKLEGIIDERDNALTAAGDEIARLREELAARDLEMTIARAQLEAARSSEAAHRAAAEASRDALATLRAALRIPLNDEPGLVPVGGRRG